MKNKKKLPWWKKVFRFVFGGTEIAIGPDDDLGDENKVGIKKKIQF